jgi:hypothetical protein
MGIAASTEEENASSRNVELNAASNATPNKKGNNSNSTRFEDSESDNEDEDDDDDEEDMTDLTPGKLVTRASLRNSENPNNSNGTISKRSSAVTIHGKKPREPNHSPRASSASKQQPATLNLPRSSVLPPPDDDPYSSMDHSHETKDDGFVAFAVTPPPILLTYIGSVTSNNINEFCKLALTYICIYVFLFIYDKHDKFKGTIGLLPFGPICEEVWRQWGEKRGPTSTVQPNIP